MVLAEHTGMWHQVKTHNRV